MGIDIGGERSYDKSGWAVSISSDGNIVAIGANGNDGNRSASGHVRVYSYDGIKWNQVGIDIDGERSYDYSGSTVSISSDGKIVAIGAGGNDDNGSASGHVRVYFYDGSQWNQMGMDIDGESANDRYGSAVAISSNGMKVAIGA